jgi:hypothetical protein
MFIKEEKNEMAKGPAAGDATARSDEAALGAQALDRLTETTAAAINKAPAEHAGVINIVFGAAIIFFLIAAWLILKGHEVLGVVLMGALLVASLFGIYVLRPDIRFSHKQTLSPPKRAQRSTWARTTLKPIELTDRQRISHNLEGLLAMAQSEYSNIFQSRTPSVVADANNVRINIFLPDTSDVELGEVCGLQISKQFQHGMQDANEIQIRFRPNEGLTGRVFTYSKAYGARRNAANAGWVPVALSGGAIDGGHSFNLTEEQINQVNRALRWIVSFPLKGAMRGEARAYGVLNLDGLNEAITEPEMRTLYQTLLPQVDAFAADLFRRAKCEITITVDDVDD